MTPFMERVTEVVDGAPADPPAVRASAAKTVPVAADEQLALRALAEQLVSEANAVLHDRPGQVDLVELEDELVDGQLAFRMGFGSRAALVRTRIQARTATGELLGVGADAGRDVELAGPDALADLILTLLAEPARGHAFP